MSQLSNAIAQQKKVVDAEIRHTTLDDVTGAAIGVVVPAASLVTSMLLAFRPIYTVLNPQSLIQSLQLDASLSEAHQRTVSVTNHTIEDGKDISDHAQPEPKQITIEGIVSNTPIDHGSLLDRVFNLPSQALTAYNRLASAGGVRVPADYASHAYDFFNELYERPRLIDITTSLTHYDNMIMTALAIPRDYRRGDSLQFSATFREINIVSQQFAFVKLPGAPVVPQGPKPTKLTPPPVDNRSWSLQAAQSILSPGTLNYLGLAPVP